MSLRARQGKLKAIKNGRNWVTKNQWLQEYIAGVEEYQRELKGKKHGKYKPESAEPPENLPIGNPRKHIKLPVLRFSFVFIFILVLLIAGAFLRKTEPVVESVSASGDEIAEWAVRESSDSINSAFEDSKVFHHNIASTTGKVLANVFKTTEKNFSNLVFDNFITNNIRKVSTAFGATFSGQANKVVATSPKNLRIRLGQVIPEAGDTSLKWCAYEIDNSLSTTVNDFSESADIIIFGTAKAGADSIFAVLDDCSSFTYRFKEIRKEYGHAVSQYTQWFKTGFRNQRANALDIFSDTTETFSEGFSVLKDKTIDFGKDISQGTKKISSNITQKTKDFFSGLKSAGYSITESTKEIFNFAQGERTEQEKEILFVEKETEEVEELKQQIQQLKQQPKSTGGGQTTVNQVVQPVRETVREVVTIDSDEVAKLQAQINEIKQWEEDIENLQKLSSKLKVQPSNTNYSTAPVYIASQGLQVGGSGSFTSLGVSGATGTKSLGVSDSASIGSNNSDLLTVKATSTFESATTIQNTLTVGQGSTTLSIDTEGNLTTTGNITSEGNLEVTGDLTVTGAQTYSGAASFITDSSPQLKVGYDDSNYTTQTITSAGGVTFDAVGTSPAFTLADSTTIEGQTTVSPAQEGTTALIVRGKTQTTNFQMTDGSSSGYILTSDASGNATWANLSSTAGPWTLSSNNLYPDDTAYNLALGATDAGTAKLYVSGNVGFGDTTPDYPFEILNTTSPQFAISYDDGTDYSTFQVDDDGKLTIVASGGEIDISNENLTTTGTITTGTLTDGTLSTTAGVITGIASLDGGGTIDLEDNLDGTGFTITGDTLTDGTASLTSGSLTGAVNGTFSGTVQAEQLTTTDDLTVQGHAVTLGDGTATDIVLTFDASANDATITFDESADEFDLGDAALTTTGLITIGNLDVDTLNLNGNAITDSTGTISFSDENLTTTGTIQANDIQDESTDGSLWAIDSSGGMSLATAQMTVSSADGSIWSNTNITANGTVQAEQLTSTDDLTVQGHAVTFGNNTANDIILTFDGSSNDGTITFDESVGEFDFGDAALQTTGDIRTSDVQLDHLGVGTAPVSDRAINVYNSEEDTTSTFYSIYSYNTYTASEAVSSSKYGVASFNYWKSDYDFTGTIIGAIHKVGTMADIGSVTVDDVIAGNFGVLNIDGDATITNAYGIKIETPLTTGDITNNYGLYIDDQTGPTTTYAIYSKGGDWALRKDNSKMLLGGGEDASLYYNGTNLIIDPREVGTGDVLIGDATTYLSLEPGSIKDSSGTIDFDDENLTTTGTLGAGAITGTSITDSGLTSGRIIFAGTGGHLSDTSSLTYSTTTDTLTMNTGQLNITGSDGASGDAPDVLVVTGGTTSDIGKGSDILFTTGTGNSDDGGDFQITTGTSNLGGGGDFIFTGGNAVDSGIGGGFKVTTGSASAGATGTGVDGGPVIFTTGTGEAGDPMTAGGDGGYIELTTGPGGADGGAGAGSYGNIYLAKNGGYVRIGSDTTPTVELDVSGAITATDDVTINADNKKLLLGAGQDASIYWDASDLIINSENVTASDELHITNFDAVDIESSSLTTTGDLTIGTDVFTVDSSEGKIGINVAPTSTYGINILGENGATETIGDGMQFISGTGGDTTTSGVTAGDGGTFTMKGGTGGDNTSTGLSFGGTGGTLIMRGGTGGLGTNGSVNTGGTGGDFQLWGGQAGNAPADSAMTGQAGGNLALYGGPGGDSDGDTGGSGGHLRLYSGEGGTGSSTGINGNIKFTIGGSSGTEVLQMLSDGSGMRSNDNIKHMFGAGSDTSIYFDGSDLIINSENVTASDELLINNFDRLNVSGQIRVSTLAEASATHVCRDGSNDLSTCSADISEYAPTTDEVTTGDVVVVSRDKTNPTEDETAPFMLEKSTETYQDNLIGVIADVVAGASLGNKPADHYKPLVLVGRVPIKVSTENGEIQPGDWLTSSSTPGTAMKATETGSVLGKALESYNSEGIGYITAFINLNWYTAESIAEDGSLGDQSTLPQPTSIQQSLASLGMMVDNGIARVRELVADRLVANNAEIKKQLKTKTAVIQKLQMVDQRTGDMYCTWIENGEWKKVRGNCDTIEFGTEAAEITGCIDPSATNYNPDATKEDGSCEYETVGFDLNVSTSTLNMEAIEFSTSPSSAVFNVMGANWQSSIEYTTPSSNGVSWLNLTPTEAETPATVKAEANSSALSKGNYFSKIIITSEDKIKEVEVNLEVRN